MIWSRNPYYEFIIPAQTFKDNLYTLDPHFLSRKYDVIFTEISQLQSKYLAGLPSFINIQRLTLQQNMTSLSEFLL